jgi:hypothetical protein
MFLLSAPLCVLKLEKTQIQTHQFSFLRQNQGGADMSFFSTKDGPDMSYIVLLNSGSILSYIPAKFWI